MRHFASCITLFLITAIAVAVPLREGPNRGWGDFVDPDKDCQFKVDGGKLTITVPGTDHDLGIERGKMNAPRAWQIIEGDFTIEVKVSGVFAPVDMNNQERRAYHGAGFIIYGDDRTYVRLDRATYWDGSANQVYANFELRKDGKIDRFGLPEDLRIESGKDTWLKIQRKGNQFFGHATQEQGKWRDLGNKTIDLPAKLRIGVAAINTSLQSFAPTFSELKIDVPKNVDR
jgi:regulation of enolase protein 1 (concanavalin A-like superfamily)